MITVDLNNVTFGKTQVYLKTLEGKDYSMPIRVYFHLKEAYNRVNRKLDALFIITGKPGSGKSNLGMGMCGTWEEIFFKRHFTLNNVHFNAEEVTKRTNVLNNQTEAIDFDEAVQGGSSKDGISRIGNIFRKALITKRSKRHLYVIIVDSLKELNDKVIERCIAWYHVHYQRYENGDYRKGIFKIFNSVQALKVYEDLKKKIYQTTEQHPIYQRNKYNFYSNDLSDIWFLETEYDMKKSKETDLLDKHIDKFQAQRDRLIVALNEEGKQSYAQIAAILNMSKSRIGEIAKAARASLNE